MSSWNIVYNNKALKDIAALDGSTKKLVAKAIEVGLSLTNFELKHYARSSPRREAKRS